MNGGSVVGDDQAAREFLKAEYDRIKSEQAQRIGFRDNMLFVQLAATGGVASWVLAHTDTPNANFGILVIPWVCVILGWTYVVNDHHISRMGKYVRGVVDLRAGKMARAEPVQIIEDDGRQFTITEFFGWEPFHRTDRRRKSRKLIQCVVDELTFFLPGVLAILGYLHLTGWGLGGWLVSAVLGIESFSLIGLFAAIIIYADFARGK